MKKIYLVTLILISYFTVDAQNPQRGVVIVPVADLVGQPMHASNPEALYRSLPWAARGSDYAACPRIHQLLFNETVDIIESTAHELHIRIPNAFYLQNGSNIPQREYWTLKKNIAHFDMLEKKQVDPKKIPHPIRYTDNSPRAHQQTVALLEPYYDQKINITFSVGTRFVQSTQQPSKAHVVVYCLNPDNSQINQLRIPRSIVYQAHSKPYHEKQNDFVRILKRWAASKGTIPYVWGGCSFTTSHASNKFQVDHKSVGTKQQSYYVRAGDNTLPTKTGFDCSNLILRAAQIVGIPYFFKNTYTIAQKLSPLGTDEPIQAGDIIWIQGHVLIISDIANSLVIEAHAYGSGYGRIHELPIKDIFQGIDTVKKLQTAYRTQTPLQRLDSNLKPFCTYKQFKLLRLPRSA